MHPSPTDTNQQPDSTKPAKPVAPAVSTTTTVLQIVAGCTAIACLVLMIADMSAPESFVPVQLRILAVIAVVGTVIAYAVRWADERAQRRDERAERRHQELMALIRNRNKDTAWIEGYVTGLHRALPPHERPV